MVENISKSNEKVLKKFIISITNKYQPNTIENYSSLLNTFSKTVGKTFGSVSREDIDVYFATRFHYIVLYRILLRRRQRHISFFKRKRKFLIQVF